MDANIFPHVEIEEEKLHLMSIPFYTYLNQASKKFKATGFASLLGVASNDDGTAMQWLSNNQLKRSPRSPSEDNCLKAVSPVRRDIGAMPVIPFNVMLENYPELNDMEFGQPFTVDLEYPQNIVDGQLADKLAENFENAKYTGRIFTVDSVSTLPETVHIEKSFTPKELKEFTFEGRKFIRMQASEMIEDSKVNINGKMETIDPEKYYFVEVQKLEFTRQKDCIGVEYAVPEKVFTGGIQYNSFYENCREERENSYIIPNGSHFIDTFIARTLSKEILPFDKQQISMAKVEEPEKKTTCTINRKNRLAEILASIGA